MLTIGYRNNTKFGTLPVPPASKPFRGGIWFAKWDVIPVRQGGAKQMTVRMCGTIQDFNTPKSHGKLPVIRLCERTDGVV